MINSLNHMSIKPPTTKEVDENKNIIQTTTKQKMVPMNEMTLNLIIFL